MKPLILVSNDDGYLAKGINSLTEMLRPIGEVVVVAPDRPRSATGCAITSILPISAKLCKQEEGLTVYSCTGTPVDCVKLALNHFVPRKPDLVISGINHGTNATINEHYSGTVSIAKEGTLHGISSIAFSLCDFDEDADFSPMTPHVQRIVRTVLEKGLPYGSLLNVNFPGEPDYKGIKICKMAMGVWKEEFTRQETYYNKEYYWLGGVNIDLNPDDTLNDNWALDKGYIAITPIKIDETDYELMSDLSHWEL